MILIGSILCATSLLVALLLVFFVYSVRIVSVEVCKDSEENKGYKLCHYTTDTPGYTIGNYLDNNTDPGTMLNTTVFVETNQLMIWIVCLGFIFIVGFAMVITEAVESSTTPETVPQFGGSRHPRRL